MLSFPGRRQILTLVLASACNPYNQQGEFNAGPVDAANFAKPYQGDGADPNVNGYRSGQGKFTEIRAFVGGEAAGYYAFPFTDTQLKLSDPLVLPQDPKKAPFAPTAYVFDPAFPSPFPASAQCTAPAGYSYDLGNDTVRYDEQGSIFTALPIAVEKPGQASTFEYIPIVAEAAVTARGAPCQALKSEDTLKRVLGVPPFTGRFLLWAIIDPSSGVYRVGEQSSPYGFADGGRNPAFRNGLGIQKWGWFGRYYLAYIDGAYVPTLPSGQGEARRMGTQRLYVPRQIVSDPVQCGSNTCTAGRVCASNPLICQNCQASGARACAKGYQCGTSGAVNGLCNASGIDVLGAGWDVLQYRRGDDGYTPVCQVYQYDARVGQRPKAPSELLRSSREIENLTGANVQASPGITPVGSSPRPGDPPPRFIYCPQVN